MPPRFPVFKKTTIDGKDLFTSITSKFDPYSDFNFLSFYSFGNGDSAYTLLNDNLVIQLPDYLTGRPVFSFLGTNNVSNTIETLLNYAKDSNHEPHLKLIPEVNIKSEIDSLKKKYSIEEDLDNFDYIMSTEKMSSLFGSEYRRQRNNKKQIENLHPNVDVHVLSLSDSQIQEEIITLCFTWGENKGKEKEDIEIEISAISNLLKRSKDFNLVAIGVYVDNVMIAFSISEPLHAGYAINHFRKADVGYTGIFTYIDTKMAETLLKMGCKYLNFEQDLGIESLRRSKESWNPIFYLKKYVITLNK